MMRAGRASHKGEARMKTPRNRSAGAVLPGTDGTSSGMAQIAATRVTLTMLARWLIGRLAGAGEAGAGGSFVVPRPGGLSTVTVAWVLGGAPRSAARPGHRGPHPNRGAPRRPPPPPPPPPRPTAP